MHSFLKSIGFVFVVIVSLLLTACGGSSGRDLTYRVTGENTNRASITYTDAEGNTQEEQVDLPWETTFGIDGRFTAKISVTNEDADGSVTCEIRLDEKEKGKQTSAAYAQCVTSFSINGNSVSSSFAGSSVESYLGRAQKYVDEGDLDKALTEVEQAIEVAPNFSDAYFVQGLVYEAREEPEKVLEAYDRAIELNPEHVGAYNNRGLIYQSMDDLDAAIADWSAAIELAPEYVHSYHNRAVAYATLGNLEAAEADVKKVIALSNDPDQVAWAKQALEKLAPTPTPEPTATPAQVTIPSMTSFEQYDHNMDCTGYNEKLLLQSFSVLYPSHSVITDCQGNPDNYVTIELEPDEAKQDAAFIVVFGNFNIDPPNRNRYITEGNKLINFFSDQLQSQLKGKELDIEVDPVAHQGNLLLSRDIIGEIEGTPRLMRLALIPNFEHGHGLFFMALQKVDTAPAEAFPAFDEVTRKIIASVEFPSPEPMIGEISFATEMTEDKNPVNPGDSFSPGPTRIYGIFEHANLTPNATFEQVWYLDGEQVINNAMAWEGEPTGKSWVNIDHPDGLPAGKYDVQLLIEGELLQTGSFVIGE